MANFESDLTKHLNGMMDSLDEHVTHEDIYEQLLEAWKMSMEKDGWPDYCPYDCDSCHDEDCPCERSGCAGSPY